LCHSDPEQREGEEPSHFVFSPGAPCQRSFIALTWAARKNEIVILSEAALAPSSKELRFARDASIFRPFQPPDV
jgi:hypothetical protein